MTAQYPDGHRYAAVVRRVYRSTRRYLVTQPVPTEVEGFLGQGLWINGKGGPISTFL